MIGRWANRIGASKKWVQALDLASRRQFEQALGLVEAIETLSPRGSNPRPTKFSVDVDVLKACLLSNLNRHEDALKLIVHLNSVFEGKTSMEKEYLEGYLSELAHFVIHRSGLSAPRELEALLQKDLNSIDLERVPQHLKSKFPLPAHPRWPGNGSTATDG